MEPGPPQGGSRGAARVAPWRVAALLAAAGALALRADYPEWWPERGLVLTNAPAGTNDFAPANVGQVKHAAAMAAAELEARLPGGAGTNILDMVAAWASAPGTSDYAAANVGQLKATAKPFYDRFAALGILTNDFPWTAGLSNGHPWAGGSNENDFALANVGQIKRVFAFDLTLWNSDDDHLPDAWEEAHFGLGNLSEGDGDDWDGDGVGNLAEFVQGWSPTNFYNMAIPVLTLVSGDGQTGFAETFLNQPFVVRVSTGGAALAQAPVSFAVAEGTGSIATNSSDAPLCQELLLRTDAGGEARVYLKYGTGTEPTNRVQATAASQTSSTSIQFSASLNPVALDVEILEGGSQLQHTNAYLPLDLAVLVTTNGGILPNATVEFEFAEGGGVFAPAGSSGPESGTFSAIAGSDGVASVRVKLASPPGSSNLILATASFGQSESAEEAFALSVDEGLVAHWKMDEQMGSVVEDSSGFNSPLSTTPTPGWLIDGHSGPGPVGRSIGIGNGEDPEFFRGAIHSGEPDPTGFGASSFTIACWFQTTSGGPIVEKGYFWEMGGYHLNVGLFGGPGRIGFNVGGAWGALPNHGGPMLAIGLYTIDRFDDGLWHHVACVVDQESDVVRVFVDGVQRAIEKDDPFMGDETYAGVIQGLDWSFAGYDIRDVTDVQYGAAPDLGWGTLFWQFHGRLDDVRIYNRALSPGDIAELRDAADADLDGLQDGWERVLVAAGSDDDLISIWDVLPDDDLDGDGRSNGSEHDAGTDPLDYWNGAAPGLQILAGDGQRGAPGAVLPLPLVVGAFTNGSAPCANAPLRFEIIEGGGTLAAAPGDEGGAGTLGLRTDGSGEGRAYLRYGGAGDPTNRVRVIAPDVPGGTQIFFWAARDLAPAAPTGLVATVASSNSVALNWIDLADSETGYRVEFAPYGGAFAPWANLPTNATGALVTGLQTNRTYLFRVRASGGSLASEWSDVASARLEALSIGPRYDQTDSSNGVVCIEAESFSTNLPGSNAHYWTGTNEPSASGGIAEVAQPNNGTNQAANYLAMSPRLSYPVYLGCTGVTYVWVRGWAATANDNTVHVGLDNSYQSSASNFAVNVSATQYRWSGTNGNNSRRSLTITNFGPHTVDVWMGKDGFVLDRLLLTTNSTYNPTNYGSGLGPAESPLWDSDHDGLPDAWEAAILAATNLASVWQILPGDDADGDGVCNGDEYGLGLDPLIASPPILTPTGLVATVLSSNEIALSWVNLSLAPAETLVEFASLDGEFATWSWETHGVSQATVTGLVPLATYRFRVKASGAYGESAWSDVASARLAVSRFDAFAQGADGLVCLEAEHFLSNIVQANGDGWATTNVPGASKGVAMVCTNDNGTTVGSAAFTNQSPLLVYAVDFVAPGTNYILIRGKAPNGNGNGDSVHAGLDWHLTATATNVANFPTDFGWVTNQANATPVRRVWVNVASTGLHTVCLWEREDGVIIDRIALTTNANYGGAYGTAEGPPESDRCDADRDGLPDAWERQISEDDPSDDITSAADVRPADDYDGDGIANAAEFDLGWDPADPFNGGTPVLSALGATGQSAARVDFAPERLDVVVTNAAGEALALAPVQFSVSNSPGVALATSPEGVPVADTIECRTDMGGVASAHAYLGFGVRRTNFVNATIPGWGAVPAVRFDIAAAPGPLAHWALDEVAGSLASNALADALHGAVVGDAAWVTNGIGVRGGYLSLDGADDGVRIEDSDVVNRGHGHGERTVSLWFRASETNGTARRVLYEEGGTNSGLVIYLQSGVVRAGGWNRSAGWDGTWLSGTGIATGWWHQVAVTLSNGASGLCGYFDGQPFAGGLANGFGQPLGTNSQDGGIGAAFGGSRFHDGDFLGDGERFAGDMDEVRLSDRALSGQEILAAYVAEGVVPSDGLELWLRADNGVTTNGSGVTAWQDNSSAGLVAAQAEAGNQPGLVSNAALGRLVVRFDGADDWLDLGPALDFERDGPVTLFVFGTAAPGAVLSRIETNASARGYAWLEFQGPNDSPIARHTLSHSWPDDALTLDHQPAVSNGAPTLWVVQYDGSGTTGGIQMTAGLTAVTASSGAQTGPSATIRSATARATIGSRDGGASFFGGDIAEILLYRRALGPDERALVETYLAGKYRPGDRDWDGLDDDWEERIAAADPGDGIATIADIDGAGDFDGDGLSDAAEHAAGSDPLLDDSDGDGLPDGSDPEPARYNRGRGSGLTGSYFANTNLVGTAALTRIDPTVSFDWGEGSPDAAVPADGFSASWVGLLEAPQSGQYTFHATADDAVRVWIDGQLIISRWGVTNAVAGTNATASLDAARKVPVMIRHFEANSNASVRIEWEGPSMSRRTIPFWRLYPAHDIDGDGMPDEIEIAFFGSLDEGPGGDFDQDGLTNALEIASGLDPRADGDADGDGLADASELNDFQPDPLDPLNPDTDGDGLADGNEVLGLGTDPLVADSDGDGLGDGEEYYIYGCDPLNPDTDGDGLDDGDEVAYTHAAYAGSGLDPARADTDGDGLSDFEETDAVQGSGTNPWVADTDGDGVGDGQEVHIMLTDPLSTDTDYDGRSDGREGVEGTDPADPAERLAVRLGHWRFDDAGQWRGEGGIDPIGHSGLGATNTWSGTGVVLNGASPAHLRYRDVETNASANINLREGSVRMWVRPRWSSLSAAGAGPGDEARLLSVGDYSEPPTGGAWFVGLDAHGTNLTFASQDAGTNQILLAAPVCWTNDRWYQVVVTYGPGRSDLYINGTNVAAGIGLTNFPQLSVRTNGFCVGSDPAGGRLIRACLEEMETFNHPLGADAIASNYLSLIAADADADGLGDIAEDEWGTNPNLRDTDGDGLPDGYEVDLGVFNPTNSDTGDYDGDGVLDIYDAQPTNNLVSNLVIVITWPTNGGTVE